MASPSSSRSAAAITLRGASTKPTYLCPTCDKSFKRPSTLNEHIRATHTTERLLCSTCEKAFKRANDLKRHEKLHSGEKAYACHASITGGDAGCRKRFARLHSLREHQRRRIGSTCWDAFVESQTQSQSRPPSPRTISGYDDNLYPYTATIHQSIESDSSHHPHHHQQQQQQQQQQQPERPSYKPIDWLNWSMRPSTTPALSTAPTAPSRPVRNQPIHPSDISWHSVLESRLRHDAESIIASSRNSSFSSTSSYPVSTSA